MLPTAEKIVPIVGGPGMWELVMVNFLSPFSLFRHERMCIFKLVTPKGKMDFNTHVSALILDGSSASQNGNRSFEIICRGHWTFGWPGGDSMANSSWYIAKYDPGHRRGSIRAMTQTEIDVMIKM